MPKSIVGTVKNKKFAFFWLLLGGSIGNVPIWATFKDSSFGIFFLLPTVLSILLIIATADKTKRPKIWLIIDLILAVIVFIPFLLFSGLSNAGELGVLLPDVLIILGSVLGIMDW